jgi:murein DD-endopeptidase MepM/ murein hydrolase activator NlpD
VAWKKKEKKRQAYKIKFQKNMDRKIIILASIITFFAAIIIYNLFSIITIQQTVVENNLPERVKNIVADQMVVEKKQPDIPAPPFGAPLDRAGERVTKKPFGIFITPQNSPVKPEKFRGYHTGTDFEIFPEELNMDVQVRAICDGKVVQKKYATGYGGVLVESCEFDGEPITVIYGHLKLASIAKKSSDDLVKGEEIGILGKANSAETNGERKHLHLGVHKGTAINILGYVLKEADLSGWIDPFKYMSL